MKSIKYDKAVKKIKDGDWEALQDLKKGKNVEFRDTSTNKKMTYYIEETDPADIDNDADENDKASAKLNIITQLRKVVDSGLRSMDVTFKKRVEKVPVDLAKKALSSFEKLKKPNDKEKFQRYVGDSLSNLKNLMSKVTEKK